MTTILVSPTQSGKTRYIQELASDKLNAGKSVFIILRNITADLLQFSSRWEAAYSEKLNDFSTDSFTPNIFICLANIPQLSKLYCLISKITHNFIIILDEADLIYLDKTNNKQSTVLFDEIYKSKFQEHKYYITATPFALFKYIPNIKCTDIKKLPVNPNYIGFDKIKKWHTLGNCIRRITTPDKYSVYVDRYIELLEYVLKRSEQQLILFNATSLIAVQEKLGKVFFDHFKIPIIVDHGEYTLLITNQIFSEFTKYKLNTNYYLFKKISIKNILKTIKNYTPDKVIIISGIKAGRGQSYKTEDVNELHLTDMIYLPPKFQSCETLIQAAGRITGIYSNPDICLHIWTPKVSRDSILEYIEYQTKILEECKFSTENITDITKQFTYSGKIKIT